MPILWFRSKFLSCFVLLCLFSFIPLVHADTGLIIDDLLARGEDFYKKQDYQNATDCFLKVLATDSANDQAKGYLKKMGVDEALYETRLKPRPLGQSEVANYERKLDALERQKEKQAKTAEALHEEQEFLRQRLEVKAEKEDALRQSIDNVKAEADEESARQKKLIAEKEKAAIQKAEEAAKLNYQLKHTQNDLEQNKTMLAARDEQLKDLADRINNLELTAQKDRVAYQTQVGEIEFMLGHYKEQASQNTREQNWRIENLQEQLRKKIVQLAYLQDRMVMTGFQAGSSKNEVTLKNRQINQLKLSLKELEKDLAYYQSRVKALEGRTASMDKQAYPAGYQDKLELLRKQDTVIAELKAKLVNTKKRLTGLQEGESTASLDQTQLKSLQDEMSALKVQLAEKEEALKEKDENYNVLSDQLKATQNQLNASQGVTENKDELDAETQKRLNDALSQ